MSIKRRVAQLNRHESKPGTLAKEWLKSAGAGLILFLVVRTFVLQTFTIISGSMEGTLLVGDFLMVSKAAYGATVPMTDTRLPGYTAPSTGDVVVFRGTAEPIDMVKRIVGGPGDVLEMRDGQLSRNGVTIEEPYVIRRGAEIDPYDPEMNWQHQHLAAGNTEYSPSRDNWGPILVPADHYFMLGDNRDESRDSRYWGPVPARNMIGKATFVYFSWGAGAPGHMPILGRIRWTRFGDRIW